MKRKSTLLSTVLLFICLTANAQWQNPTVLSDLNSWSGQSGFIGWYNSYANVPASQNYGSGIQLTLPNDPRYGAQLVIPSFDTQVYYRSNVAGAWNSWSKVWSSANLNKSDVNFICKDFTSKTADIAGNVVLRNMSNIKGAGATLSFTSYDLTHPGPRISSYLDYASGTASQSRLILSSYDAGYKNELTLMYGNVGIGTMTPTDRLSVNGNIRAKEIKVENLNWPDYVFEKGYVLKTLVQLESYINRHHHLPELPSAAEVAANGQNLGEINGLLVRNLEEVTLHLIEKNKQIIDQQKQIDEMKSQLQAIAAKLNSK
jgi:hypothetical protein